MEGRHYQFLQSRREKNTIGSTVIYVYFFHYFHMEVLVSLHAYSAIPLIHIFLSVSLWLLKRLPCIFDVTTNQLQNPGQASQLCELRLAWVWHRDNLLCSVASQRLPNPQWSISLSFSLLICKTCIIVVLSHMVSVKIKWNMI